MMQKMKERTYNILLIVLAVLLAISIFFNGWLLHGYTSSMDASINLDVSPF